MSDDHSHDYLEDASETRFRYCEDCLVLMDALRDMEQQCREAEDEGLHKSSSSYRRENRTLDNQEEFYLAKLGKLQRRRDAALEVLLKHQSIEHK